jgi:hypothetical protein
MQFPNQDCLPIFTGNEVGMQENGATRQSSPFSCSMNAWLSLKRARLARIRFVEQAKAFAISATVGDFSLRIICR